MIILLYLTLKGVSKAVGIEKLVERINRNIDDTIAFGDGRNDIEMLETVKIGVAWEMLLMRRRLLLTMKLIESKMMALLKLKTF